MVYRQMTIIGGSGQKYAISFPSWKKYAKNEGNGEGKVRNPVRNRASFLPMSRLIEGSNISTTSYVIMFFKGVKELPAKKVRTSVSFLHEAEILPRPHSPSNFQTPLSIPFSPFFDRRDRRTEVHTCSSSSCTCRWFWDGAEYLNCINNCTVRYCYFQKSESFSYLLMNILFLFLFPPPPGRMWRTLLPPPFWDPYSTHKTEPSTLFFFFPFSLLGDSTNFQKGQKTSQEKIPLGQYTSSSRKPRAIFSQK